MPITLRELTLDLPIQLLRANPDLPITHLTDLPDQATPASLFIHRRHQRREDLTQALAANPAAILTTPDNEPNVREPLALLTTPEIGQSLCGQLAERLHHHPARALKLAAVTGTNGKSTTTLYLQHLLTAAGLPTGLLGTIHNDLIAARHPATLTTPGAIELTRFLATIRDANGQAAVYEASSHALHQGRTDHLAPAAAIFTNLTQDHLDYHGDMTAYAAAKARLFDRLIPHDHAILNADDPHWPRMARDCPANLHLTTLRPEAPQTHGFAITSTARATIHKRTLRHTEATLKGPWGEQHASLPLLGDHNIANLLQALLAAANLIDLPDDLDPLLRALPPVPGRLEPIPNPNFPLPRSTSSQPAVFVDYAHTPDSLDHAGQTLKALAPGRLIILFGCGGDRDASKRPLMAAAAAKHADHLVITSDNPRSEDPQDIIKDALPGIPASHTDHLTIEPDRANAIHQTILTANPSDTILIAGKGHETYQEIQGVRHSFDDRQHALNALKERAQ
ncbi:UDP-N-acetylmuramoyl-L-alanyl-D-glutamate--2,6-diaminopimelate ligase [Mucisphaera sp.]|uniref:UDP-N-acetylmuramoyl-L-alanyl-D-glutamate--2, 6-diaminopimelate ligase n=1 Tax=Mucisphaera sp. TaxID=2913024 RepID=UPI003D1477AA